jgi:hypothetical protein
MKKAQLITVKSTKSPSFLVGSVDGEITKEGIETIKDIFPERYHGQIMNVIEFEKFDEENNSLTFDFGSKRNDIATQRTSN